MRSDAGTFKRGKKLATFQAFSYAIYNSAGGKIVQYDTDVALTEVTTVNNAFDPGETFTASSISNGSNPLTYEGTIPEIGGGLLYVFTDSSTSFYFVYSYNEFSGSGFPSSFIPGSILGAGSQAFCFAKGTSIATASGQSFIETLEIGDEILTVDGNSVPIKWIGRQTVSTRFGPADRQMPVQFAAGSLGEDLPHSDLTVTADHGMLVGGVICNAEALVNSTTITRVPLADMGETFTVYHIETENHEIILANGAAAETFIDNVSRSVFDNYAEFEALYGDVPEMEELPYPRAMSARQVPEHIRVALREKQEAAA